MYNQPYFIPGYYSNMMAPSMMRGAMGLTNTLRGASGVANAGRGLGLLGRLGSGFSAIRGVNWGGFINNASKTLGVINQTIPLVRQVGPMFNNMKSMLRVASLFKDETDINHNHLISNTSNSYNNNNLQNKKSSLNKHIDSSSIAPKLDYENYESNDYSPTFFIES